MGDLYGAQTGRTVICFRVWRHWGFGMERQRVTTQSELAAYLETIPGIKRKFVRDLHRIRGAV